MPIVELEGLSAGYENGFVVHGVSFSLEAGGFTAVLGKNGSGKSTLIKAMQKLTPRRDGVVQLAGRDINRLGPREIAAGMAYVPQLSDLAFDYTVEDIVSMGRFARRKRMAPLDDEDRAAIEKALTGTGTTDFRGKSMARLSGGEKQRVFIARALAQDAPVLLLDEPSLHLDINYQLEIFAVLKRLQRENGKAVLVAEHNINLAAGYADRLIFLKDGRVAAEGTPRETINPTTIRDIFGVEAEVRANSTTGLPEISLDMRQ